MNYIAGTLLTFIPNESKAFWAFVYLMKELNWRAIYRGQKSSKLSNLLQLTASKVGQSIVSHLMKEGMDLTKILSPFFLTMFMFKSPLHVAWRILDLFLVGNTKFI
jgi:hypothetical protein